MRINLPVTNDEYVLSDDEVIITHTDPSSRITYANSGFVHSSGYALEECLGQPQNLVRHPDMPEAAFADLWSTIKSGKPWDGVVKNRRKNGGFYWVRANVTPICAHNQIVGYMSVRTKPTRQEIRDAESLYMHMRNGSAPHLKLVGGLVRNTSLLGRVRRLGHLSLSAGTWLVLGSLATIFAGTSLALLMNAGSMSTGLKSFVLGANLLGMFITFMNLAWVQSRVVFPLWKLRTTTLELVSGNVHVRFPSIGDPEIQSLARLLNRMAEKTNGVLADIQFSVNRLHADTENIVQANIALANRTNQHASSLEETAASLEQLTAAVKQNTDRSQEATQLARTASTVTSNGGGIVVQAAHAMTNISSASGKIADIVSIIDGIAFQTNLLALNAAVEAARAGEQGKGFAVVAQEVRNLAQRSAGAAKQIKDLIASSAQSVEQGVQLAAEAEQTMFSAVDSVQKVAGIIADIHHSSLEQADGIAQINQATMHMDQMTQSDSAMAQEVTELAESLAQQLQQVEAAASAFALRLEHREHGGQVEHRQMQSVPAASQVQRVA